jgi:hypothetical protein
MTNVHLKGHNPGGKKKPVNLQCTLENVAGAEGVKAGDTVTIQGKCSGLIFDRILIVNCTIRK